MKSQKWRVRGAKLARLGLSIAVTMSLAPAAMAADETANLGEGLKQLVAPPVAARAFARSAVASEESDVRVISPVQFDDANRALVRISLDGTPAAATTLGSIQRIAGIEVVASDLTYGPGLIEAYVPIDQLVTLARTKGVQAVVPSSPMVTNVGATDSQGIVQHRVNKLPAGVDGSGITVGVMSDSYDTNTAPNSAALDISTGDLPGVGNPLGNTEPVVVLEDSPARSDEGRAMLQIVHDLAPKAKLGFATAQGGQLNFANNIRALAGDPTAPNYQPGFKADVIVDDIIYLDEPFFQDGLVAQAVDEVVAKGVSYFSSAGNRPATQAYDSKIKIVPGVPATWANTNLNFSNVPAALYAGGFHNYGTAGAVDIAQTIQFTANPGGSNTIVMQWNEPFDSKPPTAVGAPFASGVGTVADGGFSDFTFSGTAGQAVMVFVDGDDTTTGTVIPDIVLALYGPTGTLLATKDTGTNPEFIALELPATGTYTVRVSSFELTGGDYRYTVSNADLPEPVLSDYNLLFFLSTGQFVGALAETNPLTNRPIEIGGLNPNATATLQIVIARANTPMPSRRVADRIRYVAFGNVNPQEYISYLDPVVYGHNSAAGAIGVAAYPFYAPFVPEAFTSPGPSTIYFDKDSRRLRHVEYRQKPDLAAMDGANTTFFLSDTTADDDTFPNFFGTSASAPHAAAIAALVLDAAGGPGSIWPKKMREVLQQSAFAHDLDPYFSWGVGLSRGNFLAIDATADPNAISQFDPNVFSVTHYGSRSLANLSINGTGANPTNSGAIVFDERGAPLPAPGQPFVVGRTEGLTALDVQATFSLPADAPGVAGQWKQLDLSFLPGSFASGDLLSFGVDRDESDVTGPGGAAGGNSADLLGGGVLIPSGKLVPGGARFFGKFDGGYPVSGQFYNLIGHGYSQLDGYGFINAEAAVKAVQRKRR
jgi:hypothetical protein